MIKGGTLKKVFITLGIVIIDFAIYVFLGLFLMTYEDFYDESEGPYWSLESMTFWEQVVYISYFIWLIVNALVLVYWVYKLIKYVLSKKSKNTNE